MKRVRVLYDQRFREFCYYRYAMDEELDREYDYVRKAILDCCELTWETRIIVRSGAETISIPRLVWDEIDNIVVERNPYFIQEESELDSFMDSLGEKEHLLSKEKPPIKSLSDHKDDDFQGDLFRHQLVKFNRILAHLVNERTVLAWFRLNLALVVVSMKYMSLSETYFTSQSKMAIFLLLCGGLLVLTLPYSWYSGFLRFEACKEMIDYNSLKLGQYLDKMGFDFDNASLAFIFLVSFLCIVISCSVIIWA